VRTRATAIVLAVLATALASMPDAAPGAKQGPQTNWRYPVLGDHSYGNLANTRFGVRRPDGSVHKGQDIIANCGQPLVAPHKAKVQKRGWASGFGYRVVLRGIGTRFTFVYAHMKGPGGPRKGRIVKPGRRIGYVGDTDVSTGICHLHFEMWKGRWPKGVRLDPLSRLRKWEKFSKGRLVDDKELRRASKAIGQGE
jgi:murein DD-endopeptidase MepM/ murein hydrolase activator NlpD